ncbi:MAG TPA: sigma-54 dependent transcriptional regulator [Rectinemataceae bacterium]
MKSEVGELRILVVDDEKRLAQSLKDYFEPEGITADLAYDGLQARKMLEEEAYDLLVSDLRMPGMDGLALLSWLKEEGPGLPAIMISAHGEIRDAVEAMKIGAYDYLVKPFDPDELIMRIRKAVSARRMELSFKAGSMASASREALPGSFVLGDSPSMKELVRLIERAAPSGANILITGESGTGKELAARLVHNRSGREGPFVPINMGAFPEHLLESELFGYEKGAFTGADSRKMGLFESAQGGTLFLDEIGELPLHLQVKLLRVLQDRKVQRLGSVKGTPIDVRIVAATNRDLEKEVAQGKFREDLYYRINVIRLRIPPLRERREDIPALAGHFLARFSTDLGRKISGISPRALELLSSQRFPGNVRELENAMERACILAEGPQLEARDFDFLRESPNARQGEAPVPEAVLTLASLERIAIEAALKRNAGHREKTARELGITRRTLLNKINEYGLEPDSQGGSR